MTTFLAVLMSISASLLAINAPRAEANDGGFIAAWEIPTNLKMNTADGSGGNDSLAVGGFTGDSVSRDITRMGIKDEGLVSNPASGASTGVMLAVLAAIGFGFVALLTAQRRRDRCAPAKLRGHGGKRRHKHIPF